MPSRRKQFNIRLTEETEARLARLQAALPGLLGVQQLSQADLFSMGLAELERKHLAVTPRRQKMKSEGGE